MRKVKFLSTLDGDGCTEHTTGIFQHEVDFLRRDHLRRCYEVALVLTVFIVDDDNELALLEILQGIFNATEFEFGHIYYTFIC